MSRQQTPEEEDDSKEQLLAYCAENEVTIPFQELPLEWVDPIPQPPSPPSDLVSALPSHYGTFYQEACASEAGIEEHLAEIIRIETDPDIVAVRDAGHNLGFLTPFQPGEAAFRRYGPINLKKSALNLPKDTLKGERGMEISNDQSEFDLAVAKDSLLTATQEDAKFLKSIVSEYNHPQQATVVLPKPEGKAVMLSPPLLPYEPEFNDVPRPAVRQPDPFNPDFPSSQDLWDRLSSLSPQCIEDLIQEPSKPSPPKVASKESDLLSKLKVETPLTPDSTRQPPANHQDQTLKAMTSLISPPAAPRTPDSPDKSPSKLIRALEMQLLLGENYSAASSRRLALPELPPSSPQMNKFPLSLVRLYLAGDSFCGEVIPPSEVDRLNREMTWLPFIKTLKTIGSWEEEVEGDWEEFVDYTNASVQDNWDVAGRRCVMEEEVELEHVDRPDTFAGDEDGPEFSMVMAEIRKRKSGVPSVPRPQEGKRSKFSHKSRIEEYMTSQRGQSVELSDDDSPTQFRIVEKPQEDWE